MGERDGSETPEQGAMGEQVDSDSFPPGTVLAGTPHLVRRWLGQGGVGTVYETVRLDSGERRAVKVLSPHVAQNPAREERLLLEARGLAALRSRHIVGVHDVGRLTTGEAFYEMDLLAGETLRETLARGPLEPALACGLVYQALGALHTVHLGGLIHRDVKPDNLFLCADGLCVLLDFGALKVLTDLNRFPPRRFPTGKGHTVGTLRYMPPEAGTSLADDVRVDVYAAGVVLAELLAGYLRLGQLETDEYFDWLDDVGFPMPEGIPDALRPLIECATATDPAERFASAAEFAAELGWACQDAGIDLVGVRPLARARGPVSSPRPSAVRDVTLGAASADEVSSALNVTAELQRSSALGVTAELQRAAPTGALAASARESSAEPEPPARASPVAPVRPRWARRVPLVSAVALGAAGIAAGAAASLAVSSWPGPPAAVRVSPEPRREAPAGLIAPTKASAEPAPEPPAEPEPLAIASAAIPSPSAGASAAVAPERRAVAEKRALEVQLRSGKGGFADVQALLKLCRATGDKDCLERAYAYLDRLGGSR